jgi:hypothetical protein
MIVQRDPTTNQTSQAGFSVWDNAGTPARSQLLLEYSQLGGRTRLYFATPTMAGQFRLEDTAAGVNNYIAVPDASSRLRFGYTSGGNTNPVDYINGKIVFQGTNLYTGTGAGQGLYSASKGVAAVAANQWGSHLNWRHVRTDTAGNAVVPGSVTLGTVITNVNSNTPQIANLQASGGHFKVQATAAGSFEYMAAWTIN